MKKVALSLSHLLFSYLNNLFYELQTYEKVIKIEQPISTSVNSSSPNKSIDKLLI